MKVYEFIEFLKTQDQGADVHVVESVPSGYDNVSNMVPFDPDEHIEYIDLRGNPNVADDAEYKDSRTLYIGSIIY